VLIGLWHVATWAGLRVKMDPEYAKLMALPPPGQVGHAGARRRRRQDMQHLEDPFYDRGTTTQGIPDPTRLLHRRVGIGYLLAVAVAIPVGFLIGMSR